LEINQFIGNQINKKKVVAFSIAEAEFISTTELTKKILWINNLLIELFNIKINK